ncbi:hypothetical protein EYF80_007381 [Liparis tanakae]|uniref:Uncharacterized protein n=1 Tax=Liparis tanakae TaxID=230148 RepID=A0A4Z2IWX7_9TELE|nr:hypothetical protein EYF80_007381 [Liparis tanakae]
MADEMLFCRSWFLLTSSSSSSEEKEGSVSRLPWSSSSRSAPSARPPSPNVCGGVGARERGGGGGGEEGDRGRIPPFIEEQEFRDSCSPPSSGPRWDCFLPVFKKSRNEAMKPGLNVLLTSTAFCWCFIDMSRVWFSSCLPMSMAALGPGLSPSDGADPTDPSDRTGSVLDSESVLNKHSDDGMTQIIESFQDYLDRSDWILVQLLGRLLLELKVMPLMLLLLMMRLLVRVGNMLLLLLLLKLLMLMLLMQVMMLRL